MPVVSQSIIRPMVPVGASTRGLRVAHAERLAELDRFVPRLLRRAEQLRRHELLVDLGRLGAVHAQHVEHRLGVLGVARERTHATRGARAGGVRVAGHQRGDRRRPRPTAVGVVGHALRHEQRAEVGVAEAELAELAAVLGDLLGRVVGVADEDLLRGEHHLDGVLEALDVEARRRRRGT